MTMMIIQALSGLGIFLFGMLYMELALKESAGIRFKTWIKNSTSTPIRAILTGAGATAALQSSSVVTLMTLSFVSTSLVSLKSGIAIIFGSNLGTTATAWIVATLGFKVNIELFALPLIGVGGFVLILTSSNKMIIAFAKAFIGFGLLFFGLEMMKTAIGSLALGIDIADYADMPLVALVGFGFLLTALIQSSSAATAIILSALYANILTFELSAAMVIGTNIGTTVTAFLGSIGGIPDKKRAAMAHLFFNMITAMIAFFLLPYLIYLVLDVLLLRDDLTTALALFHTLFNLLGIILLAPFIPLFAKYLEKMFVHPRQMPTKYIHLVDPHVPDTAFVALRNEVSNLFVKTMKFGLLLANIRPSDIFTKNLDAKTAVAENQTRIDFDHHKTYENIKEIEVYIVGFGNALAQENLTQEQSQSLETLVVSVRESVYAAKLLKDIKNNLNEFSQSSNIATMTIYEEIRRNLAYTMIIFVNYMEERWPVDKCLEKFHKSEENNQHIMKETTLLVNKEQASTTTVISLLNTNRSVYIALQSLWNASRAVNLHFPLEDSID